MIHLGANAIGTFFFTKLPTPSLVDTAEIEPPNSVCVVKASSSGAEIVGEKTIGPPCNHWKGTSSAKLAAGF